MLPSFSSLCLFAALFACALASNDDVLSEEFCRQFPSLHLCRLHDTLQGSLVELQYLLQDTDGGQVGSPAGLVQKRKSAFVRFGKRSADTEESTQQQAQEVEKRKSAFVRFGRSIGEADKRKSQYIRFGRK